MSTWFAYLLYIFFGSSPTNMQAFCFRNEQWFTWYNKKFAFSHAGSCINIFFLFFSLWTQLQSNCGKGQTLFLLVMFKLIKPSILAYFFYPWNIPIRPAVWIGFQIQDGNLLQSFIIHKLNYKRSELELRGTIIKGDKFNDAKSSHHWSIVSNMYNPLQWNLSIPNEEDTQKFVKHKIGQCYQQFNSENNFIQNWKNFQQTCIHPIIFSSFSICDFNLKSTSQSLCRKNQPNNTFCWENFSLSKGWIIHYNYRHISCIDPPYILNLRGF